jgi:hypothetical protein
LQCPGNGRPFAGAMTKLGVRRTTDTGLLELRG